MHLLGAGSLVLSQVSRVLAATGQPAAHHWTWLNLARDETAADRQRRFAEIRAAGIGSVLLGGATAENCSLARSEGLDVHAWTWTMCRGGEEMLAQHPDWYVVSRDGKSAADNPPYVPYYHFLCPSRPEVRQYLRGTFSEVAATTGLTGVHLDYIRYPDVILPRALWAKYDLVQNEELPPYDFCYCEVCREQFHSLHGVDPTELPDPTTDVRWRQYRWNSITRVVNELVAVIHEGGKQATAAVFPSPTIARRLVRQDWPAWNLDAVLPMVYHNFYEQDPGWIEPTVRQGVAALPAERPLYAGLYLPSLQSEAEFKTAVEAAFQGGARGVALFGGVRPVAPVWPKQ